MIDQRAHRLVNLNEFSQAGLPINLGPLDISCPLDHQYILRMAIRAQGGKIFIPFEIAWIEPMLIEAMAHQARLQLNHPFIYVTVRSGLVGSQTDDQWHVDGFSTKVPHVPEQNYIWTSRDGTEYADLAVTFPSDFNPLIHNVNDYLAPFIDEQKVQQCSAGSLYCMDPYILHRRPPTTAGMKRTFVRVSFVPIEINDIHNTQNPLLPRHYSLDGVAHRNSLINYIKG